MIKQVLAFFFALGIASAPSLAHAQDKSIIVFAAASLKNALDEVNAAFTKATGIKTVASYAASSALMKQIENGAPADVFASADLDWMDYGSQKKLIKDDTRVNLLGNRLVLIAPKDSKLDKVTSAPSFDLAKLTGDGRIVTGDVRAVPVGRYAKAALEKRGARHRLCDGRQGGAEREGRRRLPRRLAPADRLSGGAHRERKARCRPVSRVPAIARGEGRIRGAWLYFPPEADVVSAASLSLPANAGNPVFTGISWERRPEPPAGSSACADDDGSGRGEPAARQTEKTKSRSLVDSL